MEDLKLVIAKNIIDLRRAAGMTQLDLAERLNYSDKAVSKWERGESVPDVSVLLAIARLFSVSLDYLTEEVHTQPSEEAPHTEDTASSHHETRRKFNNHCFITAMCVLLVWLIATLIFVIFASIDIGGRDIANHYWLIFIYAVPASTLVWLIMNCIWFNRRRNYFIISILMWSLFAAVHVNLLAISLNIWPIYILGVPGQIIILMWSRVRLREKNKE